VHYSVAKKLFFSFGCPKAYLVVSALAYVADR